MASVTAQKDIPTTILVNGPGEPQKRGVVPAGSVLEVQHVFPRSIVVRIPYSTIGIEAPHPIKDFGLKVLSHYFEKSDV